MPENISLVFPAAAFERCRDFLLGDSEDREQFCLALCGLMETGDKQQRYLVRETRFPGPGDLEEQGRGCVTPSYPFLLDNLNRCNRTGLALVYMHSHPFSDNPRFSSMDDEADRVLADLRERLYPEVRPVLSLVIGRAGHQGRLLPSSIGKFVPLAEFRKVGFSFESVPTEHGGAPDAWDSGERYDRQIRFLGESGQTNISALTVGIVGLGGMGSLAAQQLARLGVERFVLCDDDVVEESNLNRLAGAFRKDIGRPKVKVAKRSITRINPAARLTLCNAKVWDVAHRFKGCDILMGCVDSEAARQEMNELAVRYLLPYFDFATGIFLDKKNQEVESINAEFRLVVPGETRCLVCHNDLNSSVAAMERRTEEDHRLRAAAGYVDGLRDVPTPGVISLNAAILSMGLLEFMKMMSGFARPATFLMYDAVVQKVTNVGTRRNPDCPVCGWGGFLGLGDLEPIVERTVESTADKRKLEWLANLKTRTRRATDVDAD